MKGKNGLTKETFSSNGFLGGAKLGYEHLKKDSIYFGVDGTFAAGRAEDKLELHNTVTKQDTTAFKHNRTTLWGNGESRLGYNLGDSSYRVSPFIGLGWNYVRPDTDYKLSTDWFYGTAGFKSAVNVAHGFDLGLNAKTMYNFYTSLRGGDVSLHHKKKSWGYELGLPMTWHVGQTHTWDIQLEPFFADLFTKIHDKQAGARLMFNCKF